MRPGPCWKVKATDGGVCHHLPMQLPESGANNLFFLFSPLSILLLAWVVLRQGFRARPVTAAFNLTCQLQSLNREHAIPSTP